MEIDINVIASEKIKELHESGILKKRIKEGIEKTINEAIDSAVRDYTFKNEIEKKIESELSTVAKDMNFSAYTSYLSKQMEKLIGKYVKGELAEKVKAEFSKIYLEKRETIKLSEIFNEYKSWLETELSDDEKRNWGHINVDIRDEGYITYKLGKPTSKSVFSSRDKEFEFTLFFGSYKERGKGSIGYVRINGSEIDKGIISKYLSDFEALILNLMFNDTEIIVDIQPDSILYFDNEYYD